MTHTLMKKRLYIKVGKIYHNLALNNIQFIHTEGNYSVLHTDRQKYVVKTSLAKLEKQLPDESFSRIHRNFVINESAITKIDTQKNKVYIEQTDLPLGKNYRDHLFEKIIILS